MKRFVNGLLKNKEYNLVDYKKAFVKNKGFFVD